MDGYLILNDNNNKLLNLQEHLDVHIRDLFKIIMLYK